MRGRRSGRLAVGTGRAPDQIVTHPQEERRIWLEMARKNAELALATREGLRENQSNRLAALNEALGEEGIARIECFDVSHTMGEATVVSCVVFDQGAMQSSEYRRYNVTEHYTGRRLRRDARCDFPALRQAWPKAKANCPTCC
jgi:excinuclease UvrABC nuclease subunit